MPACLPVYAYVSAFAFLCPGVLAEQVSMYDIAECVYFYVPWHTYTQVIMLQLGGKRAQRMQLLRPPSPTLQFWPSSHSQTHTSLGWVRNHEFSVL